MAKRRAISFKRLTCLVKWGFGLGEGAAWKPPAHERSLVRGLFLFLEDRRALYYDQDREYGPWVRESIQEVRAELTALLGKCPEGARLVEPMRAMRAACRKFLDALGHPGQPHRMPFHMEAVLWGALGELRSAFGVHLAGLGALYKVDLPERLGEMLPASDDDQGAEGA